jgi:enoyl-CoA hydratase/carnithine racemase
MTDYQFCRVEREGPVTIITLNRPDVMNALHPPAHIELDGVFTAFAADPKQWVAIVTGAGNRAFSAGNDLKFQASGGRMSMPPSGFAGLTSRFDLDKPVIAAVNGIAMGGGFEIALACDLIVASEAAIFALPEPRVGLAALAGGLHRLPRIIGTKRALGMILTGRRVSAKEGETLGFVNEVIAPDDLMPAAKRWAAQICELSPMSVRASKQAVYKGLGEASLGDALANQSRYPAVAAMYKSADFVEGPKAFAEKRPPHWKGE